MKCRTILITFLTFLAVPALADDPLGQEADAVMRPLVRVRTAVASGSGVLVYSADREGAGEYRTFVLTNHHVVDDAIHVVRKWDSLAQRWCYAEQNDRVTVELFSYLRGGRTVLSQPIEAEIRAYRAEDDMALLELDYPLSVANCAELLPADEQLRLLQQVWAVGCSLGEDPICTVGHVTDLEELIDGKPYVMASAQIIYGNSGGGVFTSLDGRWYFCGIPSRIRVTRGGQAMTHMGFFIPASRIRAWFVAQHLDFLLNDAVSPTESFETRRRLQRPQEAPADEPSSDYGPPGSAG